MKKVIIALALTAFTVSFAQETPKKSCCSDKDKKECSTKDKKSCDSKDKKSCDSKDKKASCCAEKKKPA